MGPIPVKPKKKKLRRPKKSHSKINEDTVLSEAKNSNSKISENTISSEAKNLNTIEAKKAEELEAICRICHDTIDPTDNLAVRPCRCRNYLHQECFHEWFKTTQRTKCEICLTDFVIQNRRRLNKTQLKQNWCQFSHYVLYLFLILLVTAVTYFKSLKYLIKPPVDVTYYYLNIIAATLVFGGVVYWMDAIFLFDEAMILRSDLRIHDYYGFFGYQIHAILRPTTTVFSEYIGMFSFIVGIITTLEMLPGICSVIKNATVLMVIFIVVVGVVVPLEIISFCYLKKTDLKTNIINLMLIIGGQMLFHLIGILVLKCISSRWEWVIYIVTQPHPNIFTLSIGGITWIVGLLIIAILIKLVITCNQFCCPRESIPQLAPYQE